VSNEDFSRLSANWAEWASQAGLVGISVLTDCNDCQILFSSNDYSVHLRNDGTWWVVDTVDDRGHRKNAVARLSSFNLAEKYLIWDWVTLARSSLASGSLGTDLYKQGYAPGVEVFELSDAHIKICFNGECAILISGTATIFSHLMSRSVDEIEQIANKA
jgi:hypothetical protein